MIRKIALALGLLTAMLPLWGRAQTTREVLQPQFGKQTITVASDEVITFKDPKGDTDYTGQTSENAQSLTVFQPAEAGMSIQITFESMNMGGSGGYYSFANVYNGNPDADNSFTWATATNEVATTYNASNLPAGDILRAFPNERNQTYTDETYFSTTADGIIAVGFTYRYAYSCTGWVATVKAVKLEDMAVTGAGSNYDGVVAVPKSRQNIALANAYVTATGVMNADHITAIHFDLTQNEGAVEPTALRLYKGNAQVSATVTADGTGYKFTLDEALSEGTNTFAIKGDFLATATIGAKVQVDITKISTSTHTAGVAPFTAASAIAVSTPAVVLMSTDPQTITVTDTPLDFYDEGGIDGVIPGTASGKVTFLSGVAGKKVMVDFSKIDLNNGSIYFQSLKVYNGTEATEANLLRVFRHGETGIVRSTADNGALTIELTAAMQNYAQDGWEAIVSLFTPQAMDFGSIEVAQYQEATVCFGDQNQRIIDINIKAQNTEPAMQVLKMNFSTNGTHTLATKATLFYTKRSNEFSTLSTYKVGEAAIAADAFEITLSTPATLTEGDNRFWLCYDISEEAQNGQTIDAALVSVTANVNNAEKTENATNGNPDGHRTVQNIILSYADMGTINKNISGTVRFETKMNGTYCESGSDERINIFVPKHAGMVCQIDFEEFEVQYASTVSGVKSIFKIYAGQGTTGDLLWELNSTDQQMTGPGKIIRSTAADGALTIVFSPNNSYYYYKGFKATVSEYQSQPMQLERIDASHPATGNVSVGAKKQELLNVDVFTKGNLNALSVSELTFDLKGLQHNLEKVYVAKNGVVLGEADVTDAQTVTVAFTTPFELTEGNNIFSLLADVASTAHDGATIDAKVVSATVDGSTIAATNGDPDGQRTVKHMLIIAAGDNGEIKVATGKSIMFYDDGGPDADGADGFEATVTFAPLDAGAVIKLIDKGITFAATAHLYIYEGDAVDDSKLIADIKGTTAKFDDPIVSNSPDGKITIKYVGKGSYTRPNFAIEVQGYMKQAFEVKSYTVADVSPANVMAGQQDVQMLHVAMTVVGDYTPIEVQQFSIEALQNAALESVVVYTTGTEAAFAPVHKFGESQGANSITGSYTMAKDGVYNFWIAYNVKNDATVGAQASAKLTAFTMSGVQTTVSEDITASINVVAGAHGTYTIGAGGDYPTIQAAVDAISAGVDGPVVLNIKSGEYNEKVSVPHILGASAVNTITLQSESGNRNDVKIYHNNYDNFGTGTDYQLRQYGVLTVSGCDWFTLKNVEVTTTDLSYPGVIVVKNESRHVTIEGCYLHAATTTNSIDIVNMTAIDEANRNNDFITVRNNLIEGGYIGIRLGGTNYVRLPKQVGGVVEGNTFKNNGTKAIYVMDELGAKIRNNTVIVEANAETKISVGIFDMQQRDEYTESTEITGNIFNVAPKTYAPAINLRQIEGTANAPVIIANNVINMASLNASYSGLKFDNTKSKHVNIAHNTIRMTGTNGGAAFWVSSKFEAGYGNINVVNNIIQNETSGYAVNLYNDENLGKINFQNNIIYTAGADFFRASTTTKGDFAAFVTATGAVDCINKKVDFLSESVLEPANNLDGDLLTATALTYVSTDIAGKARPATGISIGAYEYTPDMVPTMIAEYPKVLSAIDGNASIAVRTDVAATVYCIVRKSSEAAPTADELKASTIKIDVAADREATIGASGLEIGAEYIAYLLPVSLRGTDGTMSQTAAFIIAETPAPIAVPVADVYINNSTTEWTVAQGESVTLMAMVTVDERSAPYTLTWMDSKRNVLLTETYAQADDIDPIFTAEHTPTECTDYIFTVSDNAANTTTAFVRAIVTGEAITATFENIYLDPEGHWNAQTADGSDNAASFVSGSYKFPAWNLYGGSYWYGYALSNETATTYTALKDQYRSAAGGGYNGSENYVVHFVSSWDEPQKIEVLNNAQGDIVSGFYVTNSAYAINSMTNGDGFAKKFEQGDWFKLIAKGDNNNTAEFYLADFRSTNPDKHYMLTTWEWFDLSALGQVKSITFTLESSDVGAYGMNTPSYFCIDNFGGPHNICTPVTHEFSATACDAYEWNGQTYTTSGDYQQIFTAANGCDSTVTLHLTINQPVTHEFTEVACGSYEWNGQVYTTSDDYQQTFVAANGCDSTVTLHLTINHSVNHEFTEIAEGSYTWNGVEYTESGDYEQTLTAANGCDSIVTLHLTIVPPTYYTLTYTAAVGGTIEGAAQQTVVEGGNGIAVTAVADKGYRFVQWSDGETNATRAEEHVTADIAVGAEFIRVFRVDYLAAANGSIEGAALQIVDKGSRTTAVTAVPADGYRFVSWSDGRTEATRTDVVEADDLTLVARFELIRYILTISVLDTDAKPIAFAKVKIGEKEYKADEKGMVVDTLVPDRYTYTVECDGYDSKSGEVVLDGDKTEPVVLNKTENTTGLFNNITGKLNVYPNPTTNGIYVEGNGDVVRVFSMGGQLMLQQPAFGRTYVDLERLPAGTYIVRLGNAQGKVVKQ